MLTNLLNNLSMFTNIKLQIIKFVFNLIIYNPSLIDKAHLFYSFCTLNYLI